MHGQFRPKGCKLVLSAVKSPFEDIVGGLYFAASGVFVEPFRGAQLKGMAGFTRGIGIGTVGLIAKPLVGVFDAFAHVTESIHDVARSANILDKKLASVKRMRLPYVFGLHKILLPYNPVDACSANLLRLFPLKEDKRSQSEGNEVLILSQLLQKGPGLGWYIVVTNKRIVKFNVRYDESEAPIMEWQVKLSSDIHIASSVDHRTHNQVVLQIRMTPVRADTPEQNQSIKQLKSVENNDSQKYDDIASQHNESASGKNRRGQKTNPVQHALGAFGTSKPKKREMATYHVFGDLQTERDALIQVHNAICCLTGQFDSIMSRKYSNSGGVQGDRDGYTSFGPLHFDKEYKKAAAPSTYDMSEHLDEIPWLYDFNQTTQRKSRNEWVFSDELQASKEMGGDPDWIVEARARSTFEPLPFPSVLSVVDDGLEVQRLAAELQGGQISYLDAVDALQQYIRPAGRQTDREFETQNQSTGVAEIAAGLSMIFDGEEPSLIDPTEVTVEERLEHVESMLQRLVYGQLGTESNARVAGHLNGAQQNSSFFPNPSSNRSAISALTGPENNVIRNLPIPIDDSEQLRREVEFLRRQLAQKDGDRLGEDETQSTNTKGSKRTRKRRFKKLWKF